MRANPLTSEQVDELAREGGYVVAGARGKFAHDYDVTGYRRVPRRDTAFGGFVTWDLGALPFEPYRATEEARADWYENWAYRYAPGTHRGKSQDMIDLWRPPGQQAGKAKNRGRADEKPPAR